MSNIDTLTLANGQAASGTTNTGAPVKVGAAFNSTAPVVSSGQVVDLQVDTNGNLKAVIQNFPTTQPVSGTVAVSGIAGTVAVSGAGTSLADGATFARGTTTETPVGGVVDSTTPTLSSGKVAALSLNTSGQLNVAVGNGVSSGTAGNPSANVITTQPIAGTTYHNNVQASTTGTVFTWKSTGGNLYSVLGQNTGSSTVYLHFFDTASAPTPGTTASSFVLAIPPLADSALLDPKLPIPITFANGIYVLVTGSYAPTDYTAIAASPVVLFGVTL
jgi:hypothetical protein